jgi:thymidine kinase
MFSGKTEEIIRQVRRSRVAGIPCVVVKYAKDTRYGSGPTIFTHDGSSLTGGKDLRVVEARTLDEVKLSSKENVIAVDEGQFYPDIHHVVDRWMHEGRKVYVAALDGDYRRKPFGRIPDLIPLCTHIIKLHAICMVCKDRHASYTVRTVNSMAEELIGGADKYLAVCLPCYDKKSIIPRPSTPISIPTVAVGRHSH